MSHAHMRDGTVWHFPTLTGPDKPIAVPPDADLVRMVGEARTASLPVFTKSLIRGAMKHHGKERYAAVNRARLVLARACIERLLTEARV